MFGMGSNSRSTDVGFDENPVLREQVEENFRFAAAASVAGIVNAAIITAVLWSPQTVLTLMGWVSAIMLGTGLRFWALVDNKRDIQKQTPATVHARRIEFVALTNGLAWGAGTVLFTLFANPTQYMLLLMVCSGMMGASVTTYTSMARAGVLFIAPLALGGLASLWVHPSAPSISGTLLLACYCVLLVRSAKVRERRFRARIQAREELATSNETVKLLLNDFEEQSADWLWHVDRQGLIAGPNKRFCEAAGRAEALLENALFETLFTDSKERVMLHEHIYGSFGFRNLTLKLVIDGAPRWWTLSGQPTADGGMRGVASDVTAQKRAEERVSYMAHYDGLTDLANRFLFNDTLRRALKRRGKDHQVAVLCLDLDSFKSVNDSLGHPIGDKLLCEVARRIEKVVREEDLIARLGGDEFAVLLQGADAGARAEKIADRIIETVSDPCVIDEQQVVTSCSIGIAYSANEDADPTLLMTHADLALYTAKENGRNRFAFFEPGMDKAAKERRDLEMDLRAAISLNEFELYFQPLVNIDTGQTVSYEALIRWNHPTRGIVMPDDFIPIAEESGLIVQLGEWVIRNAAREVANWPEHLHVSINLSPAQMRSTNLLPTVFGAIAQAGIDPDRLELEITENVLLNDSAVNIATLHKLRDFGVRISLDDFGTGYSSLNYLRSFPFDKIKIDKCFVSGLADNPDCQAIVRAVTGLASNLGMVTTAEGVEEESQLELLRNEGCTEAQGFLFARPGQSSQFTDLRVNPKAQPTSGVAMLPAAKIDVTSAPSRSIEETGSEESKSDHPAAQRKVRG
ncbi:MAG: EAL domain-containing protein [Erythrobacter sp.]|uniref:putative bifunctional diguanylate cyclase/phosphodiesterase n=1 Tax=Erythrobacter sp. TaxID=1042 RepID=UPI0032984C82